MVLSLIVGGTARCEKTSFAVASFVERVAMSYVGKYSICDRTSGKVKHLGISKRDTLSGK